MTTMTEFDPAIVRPEDVVGLTRKQCDAVLALYEQPSLPPKWKLSDVRKVVHTVVVAHLHLLDPPEEPEVEPKVEEPEQAEVVEEPGTELEPARPEDARGLAEFPDASRWQQMTSMSQALAKSRIVPDALREKPEDILVIMLAAHDLGISPTYALQQVHVIKGKPGLSGQAMMALIRRDGHSITPDSNNNSERATVHYRRKDNGDSGSISFTIDEAIKAGLVRRDGDKLKSVDGKDPWVKFTADMLLWRAVSRCGRQVFSECIGGIGYTPEELGYIDADDDPMRSTSGRHAEATVTLNEQRAKVSEKAQTLEGDERSKLAEEWKRLNLPRTRASAPGKNDGGKADFGSLTGAAVKQVERFIDGLLAARAPSEEREASNPGADEAEGSEEPEVAVSEPGNAPAATEAVSEVSPADTGSIEEAEVVEGEIVERCNRCGEEFGDGDFPIEDDGKLYHAGHEPEVM